MIITILIIGMCTNVMAATGDLYNKYKNGDFSKYTTGTMEDLAKKLEEERTYLATEGLLGEQEMKNYNELITKARNTPDSQKNTTAIGVDNSLDNFMKKNGIENMTEAEIREKLKNISFDEAQQKTSCTSSVSQILGNIDNVVDDEKKMERLQQEFEAQAIYAYDENDPFYQYYGYALGLKKKQIKEKQAIIGDTTNKTEEDLQKKFDETLDEYNKLPADKKESYEEAKKYSDALLAINNQISNKQQNSQNLSKIEPIYDVAINTAPTQTELDNNNGGAGSHPSTGKLGTYTPSAKHTPDEIITEANEFTEQGSDVPIDGENLKDASSTLYNLLLSIGILLSVAIGVYLGVKFMLSTAEDKAKVKEALIPYIVGCVIIFSAFIVWKLMIEVLGGIS